MGIKVGQQFQAGRRIFAKKGIFAKKQGRAEAV
jgi:hypothetical protein